MLIDIHRHAEDPGVADVVLRNLFHNQAIKIICDHYYSIGLHPWHVNEHSLKEDLDLIREAAVIPQVLAIGEAGLDKSISTPFDIQLKAFEAQVEIAIEADKPMIIHCVRAYNEVLNLKSTLKTNKPWIIHWFNASVETGKQLISKDFYLSFGHMLFNDQSKAFKVFVDIEPNRLFFETDDAGYTIAEVYERAAQIRGMHLSDLQDRIKINFKKCFGIKL